MSNETIHIEDHEEATQNIEVVNRSQGRQNKNTARTKEERKTINKTNRRKNSNNQGATTNLGNRN